MKLSAHAKERMEEMGVDADEVYETLRNAEASYPGAIHHPNPHERRTFYAGRLAVVTEGKWIVTVLWHGREGREEAQA